MITETTISAFQGFDTNGIPEFVRARKAMQYSASIDDFARLMTGATELKTSAFGDTIIAGM